MWLVLLFTAFLQGMAKGGLPGLTVMAVPLVAAVIPGKASTGLVLPMLIVGDLFALAYWRRSLSLPDLLRALPWAVAGVIVGWFLLGRIEDAQMRPIIGATVLLILGIHIGRKWRAAQRRGRPDSVAGRRLFAAFMGAFGGVTTMLANAAGPIIGTYLLSLKLSKETFLGTSAWFFFIVNWIKFPFMVQQGMITGASLRVNVWLLPGLVAGVAVGVWVARRINQKTFDWLVTGLAALASLRLVFQ